MKLAFTIFCVASEVSGSACAQNSKPLLDQEDAWLLVMNIPNVMEVEVRKGCPSIEFTPVGNDRIWALVRNECPQKLPASGTLGMYTVDLRDGRIWSGVDPGNVIDSDRLRRLRKVLLARHKSTR